jgi:hypothetical protein
MLEEYERIQETLKSDAVRPMGGIGFVFPGMLRPRAAGQGRTSRPKRAGAPADHRASSAEQQQAKTRTAGAGRSSVERHAERRRGDVADAVGGGDHAGDAALLGQRHGERLRRR